MNHVIGIDPGLTGSIVMLSRDGEEILFCEDMPVISMGKQKMVNAPLLADVLTECLSISALRKGKPVCAIERVNAMPGQGVSSMFRFGQSYGIAIGVVSALRIPITYVTPQAWKKTHTLTGKDKDASRSLAINLFPQNSKLFALKGKGQARADASLIALHHQRV